MRTAVVILTNTPPWVFALLALLIWQGCIAAAKLAAATANADHSRGFFPDGAFPAGAGRKIDRLAAGLGGQRGCICGIGPLYRAAVGDNRPRNRSHPASRQRDS